jgi:hypothetical protein
MQVKAPALYKIERTSRRAHDKTEGSRQVSQRAYKEKKTVEDERKTNAIQEVARVVVL